jgi:hypothetical protein
MDELLFEMNKYIQVKKALVFLVLCFIINKVNKKRTTNNHNTLINMIENFSPSNLKNKPFEFLSPEFRHHKMMFRERHAGGLGRILLLAFYVIMLLGGGAILVMLLKISMEETKMFHIRDISQQVIFYGLLFLLIRATWSMKNGVKKK